MSIKIFGGVRLHCTNLIDLSKKVAEWRERVKELTIAKINEYVAEECARLHDARVIGMPSNIPDDSSIATYVRMAVLYAGDDPTPHQLEAPDTGFTLTILPLSRRKTLGIVHVSESGWREEFTQLPWVSDYAYWNNSDRPDEISASEWRRRAKDWDKAISPYGFPSEIGMTLDCSHKRYFPRKDELLAAQPPLHKRAMKHALTLVMNAKSAQLKNEGVDTTSISAFLRLHDWATRDETGKAEVDKLAVELMLRLPERIEAEHIFR